MTRTSRRTPVMAASAVALGLLLVACGGGSSGGSTSSGAPAAAAPAGNTLTATETDFHIALSKSSIPAGTYAIKAVNSGQTTHALEINGPGVSDKATAGISPSSTATLTVTLTKGSYEIWCPVANHKAMGMDTHITVT
jgi:plastocyanin